MDNKISTVADLIKFLFKFKMNTPVHLYDVDILFSVEEGKVFDFSCEIVE